MSKKYSVNLTIINFETGERIDIKSPTTNELIENSIWQMYQRARYKYDTNEIFTTEPAFMRDFIPIVEDAETFNLFSFLLDAASKLTDEEQDAFETILMQESDLVLAASIILSGGYCLTGFGEERYDYGVLLNSLNGFVAYTSELLDAEEMWDKISNKYNSELKQHQVDEYQYIELLNNALNNLYYRECDYYNSNFED